jgi:hypothetical protein
LNRAWFAPAPFEPIDEILGLRRNEGKRNRPHGQRFGSSRGSFFLLLMFDGGALALNRKLDHSLY